jgi:hypothetical protein
MTESSNITNASRQYSIAVPHTGGGGHKFNQLFYSTTFHWFRVDRTKLAFEVRRKFRSFNKHQHRADPDASGQAPHQFPTCGNARLWTQPKYNNK